MISLFHNLLNEEEILLFNEKLLLAEKAYLTGEEHNYYIECINRGFLIKALNKVIYFWCNQLSNEKDINFLTVDEICISLKTNVFPSSIINSRKEEYKKQNQLFPPKTIYNEISFIQNNISLEETVQNNDLQEKLIVHKINDLSGLHKNVKGIVKHGFPSYLNKKTILALYNGHEGDIIPLLPWVQGILFQEGSPFDHIGIIAREMQIPCIYYLKDDIHHINNGDTVEINGTTGEVFIYESEDIY